MQIGPDWHFDNTLKHFKPDFYLGRAAAAWPLLKTWLALARTPSATLSQQEGAQCRPLLAHSVWCCCRMRQRQWLLCWQAQQRPAKMPCTYCVLHSWSHLVLLSNAPAMTSVLASTTASCTSAVHVLCVTSMLACGVLLPKVACSSEFCVGKHNSILHRCRASFVYNYILSCMWWCKVMLPAVAAVLTSSTASCAGALCMSCYLFLCRRWEMGNERAHAFDGTIIAPVLQV